MSMTPGSSDASLLASLTQLLHAAGDRLLARFSVDARPADRTQMFDAGRGNEAAALDGLREALAELRPGAGWVDEALETSALPPGEWWTVDAVEGNVNHVHGMAEWCVSAALLRDGQPVLAAVRQPVGDWTFSAMRGAGAFVNGRRLGASTKASLSDAIAGTGQAEAGQRDTHRRIGASIVAMLDAALLVRASVPSTFPMLRVAAGHEDIFWQYAPVLPGVAAGALFVSEAGGVVSRLDGSAWFPGAEDILVAAPGLHREAVRVLEGT